MIINHIVAKAHNNAIGKDNQLIWHLSNDLKFFRKITTGHYLITGRKNYESIGRPLPGRIMIIVTRDASYQAEGSVVVNSVNAALEYLKDRAVEECFVIGGGQIYTETLAITDKIFLTEVDCTPEADVFYPELKIEDWVELLSETHLKDEKNPLDYTFKLLRRKKVLAL